jgi:predicted DNA-binding transcriptional regulator AlpA
VDTQTTLGGDTPTAEIPVNTDLLIGIKAISLELGLSPPATWRLLKAERIPGARKLGPRLWSASRRQLRLHFVGGEQSS